MRQPRYAHKAGNVPNLRDERTLDLLFHHVQALWDHETISPDRRGLTEGEPSMRVVVDCAWGTHGYRVRRLLTTASSFSPRVVSQESSDFAEALVSSLEYFDSLAERISMDELPAVPPTR